MDQEVLEILQIIYSHQDLPIPHLPYDWCCPKWAS